MEAAGQPSACRVIKTLRAEQPLLGGWQWFNETRAVTQHSQLQTQHSNHFGHAPLPWLMPSPNDLPGDPSQKTGAFGNSST